MQNRRQFVQSFLSMPLALAGGSTLSLLPGAAARAAETSGYRALVCVFLFGGMDGHDTLLPVDQASYDSYARIRASLLASYAALPGGSSRARERLLELEPISATFGTRRFGLPPELSALHSLFQQGRAAIVGNVGPLLQPTNRDAFLGGTAALPARLFSHNDQQSTWMAFAPEGALSGWGGAFGDAMAKAGANADEVFSQISVAGDAVFLTGKQVSPYQISAGGVPSIALIDFAGDRVSAAAESAMRAHFAAGSATPSNLYERDIVDLSRISLDANDTLADALAAGTGPTTPFPDSALGAQLRTVAQTIAVRDQLGADRQVFFVALGGLIPTRRRQ